MTPIKPALFDLLIKNGWVRKSDVVLAVIVVVGPWLAKWKLDISAVELLLAVIIVLLLWVVLLSYRAVYFLILVKSTMDSLPATSARLAVQFLKIGQPPG